MLEARTCQIWVKGPHQPPSVSVVTTTGHITWMIALSNHYYTLNELRCIVPLHADFRMCYFIRWCGGQSAAKQTLPYSFRDTLLAEYGA